MSTFLGAMALVGIAVTAYVALDIAYRTARFLVRKVRQARGLGADWATAQETSAAAQARAAAALDLARQRVTFAEVQEAATRGIILLVPPLPAGPRALRTRPGRYPRKADRHGR